MSALGGKQTSSCYASCVAPYTKARASVEAKMTLQDIPNIHFFTRLYWNQMGPDAWGSLARALRQMLADASKLPDGGSTLRHDLRLELMRAEGSSQYEEWLGRAMYDPDIVRKVGGRFVLPEEIPTMLTVLDAASGRPS